MTTDKDSRLIKLLLFFNHYKLPSISPLLTRCSLYVNLIRPLQRPLLIKKALKVNAIKAYIY